MVYYSGIKELRHVHKIALQKPLLLLVYGFPGSGKTHLSRNLAETLQIAHVSADRIRYELFDQPRYDRQENAIVNHLMNYMTGEFLTAGVSVIYDVNAMRSSQRRELRELARKHHADSLLVWLQIDAESAYARTQKRDRRTSDDKYALPHTRETFDQMLAHMQNPVGTEDYLVVSGKHSFTSQKSAVMGRLYNMGMILGGNIQHSVTKPGLVNLVPNPQAGRVDLSRRNITIR